MTPPIQHVVESLRTELQHYGGSLALIEVQRTAVERDHPCAILTFGYPHVRSFRESLPFVLRQFQPLLEALIAEVDRSISELRTQAATTQDMLDRALEHAGRLLASINPPDMMAPDGGATIPSRADLNAVSVVIV